jgi:hypothetical protein
MNKILINKKYLSNLRKVERVLGNQVTTGTQLDNFAKRHLGRGYKGIYSEHDHLPELGHNEFIIINKPNNTHWITAFNMGGKIFEFDSFGRDMMGKKYRDFNKIGDGINEQRIDENSCGQRVLSILMTLFK